MKKAIFVCLGLLLVVLSLLMPITEELTFVNVVIGVTAFCGGLFSIYIGTQID